METKIATGIFVTLSKVLNELNNYKEEGWMIYKVSCNAEDGLVIALFYKDMKKNKASKMLKLAFENEELKD